MKCLCGLLIAILLGPFPTLALEPSAPSSFCSRFIDQSEIDHCHSRANSENIDWYAGSVCDMQKQDAAFWKCWDSVKDKAINLQALKKCEDSNSDDERQACVTASFSNSRSPASGNSSDLFQPLKSKKKK